MNISIKYDDKLHKLGFDDCVNIDEKYSDIEELSYIKQFNQGFLDSTLISQSKRFYISFKASFNKENNALYVEVCLGMNMYNFDVEFGFIKSYKNDNEDVLETFKFEIKGENEIFMKCKALSIIKDIDEKLFLLER